MKKLTTSEVGRIGMAALRKKFNNFIGKDHPAWKGNKLTNYGSIHQRMRKIIIKPNLCEECNQSPSLDLANISGEYTLLKSDWEYLCRKCHMIKDGRLFKFIKNFKNNCKKFKRGQNGQFLSTKRK